MPRYPELSEARTLHDLRTGPDGDLVAVCEDCSPLVDSYRSVRMALGVSWHSTAVVAFAVLDMVAVLPS